MGCQSSVDIGEYLTFSICTHDPDTGELTDTDSSPTYRVYEDETTTPILTGTMAKLDDANTTGFYAERILCNAANGFENGKSYTVYVEATVDGDTGGISYGFRAGTDVWSSDERTLTMAAATIAGSISGQPTLVRGDTWSQSFTGLGDLSSYATLDFTMKEDISDLDSAAILRIRKNLSGVDDGLIRINGVAAGLSTNGSIAIDDIVAGNITVTLKAVSSQALVPGRHNYDIQMVTDVSVVTTLGVGTTHVIGDTTRAIG